MKKNIIIIYFLCFSFFSYSQNTFELLIDFDNSQRNTSVVSDNNGNFILTMQEFIYRGYNSSKNNILPFKEAFCLYNYKGWEYNSSILKISKQGKVVNAKYFKTIDKKETIIDITQVNNNEFIASGFLSNNYDNFLWLIKLDSNLNIIWNKKIEIDNQVARMNSKMISENKILFYGGLGSMQTGYTSCIFEIDTSGNLIDSAFLSNGVIFDMLKKHDNSGYLLFQLVCQVGYNEILEIDTNYNIIKQANLPELPYDTSMSANSNNCYWLSDSTYILSGNTPNDISLVIADTTHTSLLYFIKDTETIDFIGFWDNISLFDKNNIYFLGTLDRSVNPYETRPSNLIVTKFDNSLNLKWEKIIGGDAYYNATNIIATKDGGCLIAATRSDSTNIYDYDSYLIKFDSLGNYPANIEDYNIKISDFVVYPNPADKILNIKKAVQVKNANFLLYNSNGKMVLSKNITQNITNLNISNLNTGVYIYNFLQKGKITDKGKIIIK